MIRHLAIQLHSQLLVAIKCASHRLICTCPHNDINYIATQIHMYIDTLYTGMFMESCNWLTSYRYIASYTCSTAALFRIHSLCIAILNLIFLNTACLPMQLNIKKCNNYSSYQLSYWYQAMQGSFKIAHHSYMVVLVISQLSQLQVATLLNS